MCVHETGQHCAFLDHNFAASYGDHVKPTYCDQTFDGLRVQLGPQLSANRTGR